jgi:hypothetical protein
MLLTSVLRICSDFGWLDPDPDPEKNKKEKKVKKSLCFEGLVVLFCGLTASPVARTSLIKTYCS